jgi:PAS domain S-box-containing protein
MPQLVWIETDDSCERFVNRRWLEFVGSELGSSIAPEWSDLLHPDDRDRAVAAWRWAVQNEAHYEQEYRMRGANGAYRWFLARGEPVRGADGKLRWFGTNTDIHEQKLRESGFAVLSHDLRNPLAEAKACAALLPRLAELCGDPSKGQLHESQRRLRELVARINRAIDRSDRMIQGALDDSVASAKGQLFRNARRIELGTLVRETVDDFASLHLGSIEVEPLSPMRITACAVSVRRALENLLSNAIKYGTPEASIRVGVEGAENEPEVRIWVHNWGDPIAPDAYERIFQPYDRGGQADAQAPGERSWGLGLFFVKQVAETHGGSVEVESSAEAGTRFTLRLARA